MRLQVLNYEPRCFFMNIEKKNTSDKTMLKKIASSPKQQTDEEQLESIA